MVSIRNCLFAASLLSAVCNAAPLLSLTQAQRIAARDAPQIDAQAAALRAAQHASVGAGELSDPKLIIGIDNLPLDGADRYNLTRDFMTMRKIGVMQDFTRGEKLRLRVDRAEAEVAREAALLSAAKFNLRRDVALAWIERHFAQRQRELVKELMREAELQVATTTATLAGGRGLANDPLTARMAEAQLAELRCYCRALWVWRGSPGGALPFRSGHSVRRRWPWAAARLWSCPSSGFERLMRSARPL